MVFLGRRTVRETAVIISMTLPLMLMWALRRLTQQNSRMPLLPRSRRGTWLLAGAVLVV
jgi:hypothetical protein